MGRRFFSAYLDAMGITTIKDPDLTAIESSSLQAPTIQSYNTSTGVITWSSAANSWNTKNNAAAYALHITNRETNTTYYILLTEYMSYYSGYAYAYNTLYLPYIPILFNYRIPPSPVYTITGISTSGGFITYTVNNVAGMFKGGSVTITGVSPSVFNIANATITSLTPTTFTIQNSATGAYSSGGTAVPDVPPNKLCNITGVSASGGVITYTADNVIGMFKGGTVTITGVSPTQYNIANATITSLTTTTFTIQNSATGPYSSGGTAVPGVVTTFAGVTPVAGDTAKTYLVQGCYKTLPTATSGSSSDRISYIFQNKESLYFDLSSFFASQSPQILRDTNLTFELYSVGFNVGSEQTPPAYTGILYTGPVARYTVNNFAAPSVLPTINTIVYNANSYYDKTNTQILYGTTPPLVTPPSTSTFNPSSLRLGGVVFTGSILGTVYGTSRNVTGTETDWVNNQAPLVGGLLGSNNLYLENTMNKYSTVVDNRTVTGNGLGDDILHFRSYVSYTAYRANGNEGAQFCCVSSDSNSETEMRPVDPLLKTILGTSFPPQNFVILSGFGSMFATNLQNIVPGKEYLLTYYVGARPGNRVPSRTATTTLVMPVAIENVVSMRTNFSLTSSSNAPSPASVATQTLNFCGTSVTPGTTSNTAVFFSKATQFWGDGTALVGGWTKVTFQFTATPRTGSNTNSFYLRVGPFPFLSTTTSLVQNVAVCIGGLSIARIT